MLCLVRQRGQFILIGESVLTVVANDARAVRLSVVTAPGAAPVLRELRRGESFALVPGVTVKVIEATNGRCVIGVGAPRSVLVLRGELVAA